MDRQVEIDESTESGEKIDVWKAGVAFEKMEKAKGILPAINRNNAFNTHNHFKGNYKTEAPIGILFLF